MEAVPVPEKTGMVREAEAMVALEESPAKLNLKIAAEYLPEGLAHTPREGQFDPQLRLPEVMVPEATAESV